MFKTMITVMAISLPSFAFAGNFAMTRSFLYNAGPDAFVPEGFHPLPLEAVMSVLNEEAKQSCGGSDPAQIIWKTWTENRMSYGRQTYWIRGEFQCAIAP